MQENKAISRRTLAKASAWAVPVLAVAAAAPAHATSTDVEIPCPDNVFPGSGWVTTFGGSTNSAGTRWNGETISVITDADDDKTGLITTTNTFQAVAGRTYKLRFRGQTKKGYMYPSSSCATVNSKMTISLISAGSTLPAFRGHTQSGPAGSVLVQPPTNCSSGSPHNGRPVRGANGTSGLFHTVNYTYTATVTVTATVTGTTTVQIRLDMDATSSGNNDDWHITPRFTECTRPAWRRLA